MTSEDCLNYAQALKVLCEIVEMRKKYSDVEKTSQMIKQLEQKISQGLN